MPARLAKDCTWYDVWEQAADGAGAGGGHPIRAWIEVVAPEQVVRTRCTFPRPQLT
jgi:hypothetical protein